MLKRFGFRRKMYYLCPSEEENALNTGVFSSFFAENGPKNHCFIKHIEKFICRREISTGFCGFFLGQVGARIDDIGTRKGNYSGQYYPPLAHAQLLPSISTRVQKCELKRL